MARKSLCHGGYCLWYTVHGYCAGAIFLLFVYGSSISLGLRGWARVIMTNKVAAAERTRRTEVCQQLDAWDTWDVNTFSCVFCICSFFLCVLGCLRHTEPCA